MSVYGSDNVTVLGNNTSVIVLDGSIQSSRQQASVGSDYFRISSMPSNLEGTQSVAWFLPEKGRLALKSQATNQ
jgi:hypothetical protein